MEIKFKGLNIDALSSFSKKANIKEKCVIEITKDKIFCKAHPTSKTFVKYVENDLSKVFEEVQFPEDFEGTLYLPFNSLRKFIDMLSIYVVSNKADSKINGAFDVRSYKDGDFEGKLMNIKSSKMKTKMNLGEITMTQYLANGIWENISSYSDENLISSLKLSSDSISELLKLFKFELDTSINVTEVKKFIISYQSNNTFINIISFEDKWELKLDTTTVFPEDFKIVIQQKFITLLDKDKDHSINITKNKQNIVAIADEISDEEITKYISVGQIWDPNVK